MKNILLCFILLSLVACTRKGNKVIQEEPITITELSSNPPVIATEEVEEAVEEEIPVPIPPYLVAVIKKTECYGICPVFEIRLFSNGHLTYYGEKDVSLLGRYEAWTDEVFLEAIKAKAYQVGYFNLLEVYPANQKEIEDIPKTITYLNFDEREKTIINNYASPKVLRDFENYLEETLFQVDWKKMNSGS